MNQSTEYSIIKTRETHSQRMSRIRKTATTLRLAMAQLGDTILACIPGEGLDNGRLDVLETRLTGAAIQLQVLRHALVALDTINRGESAPLARIPTVPTV